jgi:hypothetical protein
VLWLAPPLPPLSTPLIKLKFDQLYCINELLANGVLLVSKILLDYEEALLLKKLEISNASQILVLSWSSN